MSKKIPKGALRFVTPEEAAISFAEDGSDKMDMTVYSGGVIKNHWWWGDIAFDLKGVKFKGSKFPVLEDHMTSKKIGFTGKPLVDGALRLDPEKTEFVDTEESLEFRKLSKQGFPFQASHYSRPLKIQRLGENEEAEVNGFKLKGPDATIWREWEFKEASVTVFGADEKTKSKAFSREITEEVDYLEEGGEEIQDVEKFDDNLEGGDKTMDINEFKQKYPDLFSQVIEEGKKSGKEEAENSFSQERQGFQSQLDSVNQKLTEQQEKFASMDKELTLSREAQMKAEADKLFSDIFAGCEIEPRLEDKVRNQINHQKFVKDNKLDVEAFSKAVEEEIEDWEKRMPSTGVNGFSTSTESEEGTEENKKFAKENKDTVKNLLERAGQKTEE